MNSSRTNADFARKLATALVLLAVGIFAWFPLINSSPGAVSHRVVFAGLAMILLAFGPLALIAPFRPFAPLRIALAIAVIVSLLDAMSLPAPLRPESVSSFIAFLLIAILAVVAHLLAGPRPRVAFGALLALGVIGVYFGYAVDWYATSPVWGAKVKSSSWFVAIIATACIAACRHGRRLLASARDSDPAPAL